MSNTGVFLRHQAAWRVFPRLHAIRRRLGTTTPNHLAMASTAKDLPSWSQPQDRFLPRHIGPDAHETAAMFEALGVKDMEHLIGQTVPESIRLDLSTVSLPEPIGESKMERRMTTYGALNTPKRSFIGMGFYPCNIPSVIKRQILENPGWYTQYTPYQSEISQGRLESLVNFQTMVSDLTGLEIANASLLDEATAAAEAMAMCFSMGKQKRKTFLVDRNCFDYTIDVVRTRAEPHNINVVVDDAANFEFTKDVCGVLMQYPNAQGQLMDMTEITQKAHDVGAVATCATDLLALTLLKSPGEMGFDIAFGNSQRFGVPLGYGGPHAAFICTQKKHVRKMPGRIAGVSKDKEGRVGYRLTIQTRETHIKRERATSNICTAQALLANMAAMFAVYHGPQGLKNIATRIHGLTVGLKTHIEASGYQVLDGPFFDTLVVHVGDGNAPQIHEKAENSGLLLRHLGDSQIGISLDEATSDKDLRRLMDVFTSSPMTDEEFETACNGIEKGDFGDLTRTSEFMTHPVFNTYHSELELTRYLKHLENKDLSMVHSMIALGSCTMKLNSCTEMAAVTMPNFAHMHPFAPLKDAVGYTKVLDELKQFLLVLSGYDDLSFQPASGAAGEYAGLRAINEYHKSRGEGHRNICLVPASAHGTNPASAQMAGMDIVKISNDHDSGEIKFEDLKKQCEKHGKNLAAIMITYPSTYGVFDENIRDVIDLVHEHGGQVYLDGANMNAQLMLCRPGDFGADVSHFNLHKTFCIPHGGGGPGMGPIGVKAHLAPFLPSHTALPSERGVVGAVSSAPYGSSLIATIPWAYITMMGVEGMVASSSYAILNANYMAKRLENHFNIRFRGKNGFVAHEFIIDLKKYKPYGITCVDVAKRLGDYGFHSPTMAWPLPDSLMIEPTESESKDELDRLCDALIGIQQEAEDVVSGKYPQDDNVIVNAPHPIENIMANEWPHPYSREMAAFPLPFLRKNKFWPSVSRIDDAFGDKAVICSCPSVDEY